MKKLLVITITAVLVLGIFGIVQPDSHATKSITKQSQQPLDNATTIRPDRQQSQQPSEAPGATTTQPERQQSQQPSEAPGATTTQPERQQSQQPSEAPGATTTQPERQQSQQPSEVDSDRQNGLPFETEQSETEDQQLDESNDNVELEDEQIKGVDQEDENEGTNGDDDDNEGTNGDDENEIDDRLNEADKKAPIAIAGDNIYVVWFNDQNTPYNNSEVLFRSSNNGGATFTDKMNLSNTTSTDSINAEIDVDGNNVVVTWWEHNATSKEPVAITSTDSGETFGPILQLSTNGTIGQTTEEEE
jgi:hypothetical protein